MTALRNREFQSHTERIEQMVERVSQLSDAGARATALELLQSVMDLHGAAISRIVEVLDASESGRASLTKLANDPLICGMLVLYGVHPMTIEDRIAGAMASAAPQLRKKGGTAELLGINDAMVRVRIQSSGHGCGSSVDALKETVEQAIREAAPEVVGVVVEGVLSTASGFVPLNLIQPATREETNYEESAA
jgi:Fe-S cluster biogenesis protein NfuA